MTAKPDYKIFLKKKVDFQARGIVTSGSTTWEAGQITDGKWKIKVCNYVEGIEPSEDVDFTLNFNEVCSDGTLFRYKISGLYTGFPTLERGASYSILDANADVNVSIKHQKGVKPRTESKYYYACDINMGIFSTGFSFTTRYGDGPEQIISIKGTTDFLK